MKARIALMAGLFGISLTAFAPKANAGMVFFNVPGLHPLESARVGEQIVCANIGCTMLDYQFYVANTGAIGIDGFALGLGVVNAAAQIAGGMTTFATAGGGADGPFPAQPLGGVANGGTAVLGPCGLVPAACNPAFAGPLGWGFEEFQDAETGGGLPATFYITRWYNPVQGFNPGCGWNGLFNANLFAANAAGVLCPGQYTRMDLLTVFPPAGGNGAVDPPADLPFIGFDDIGGDTGDAGGNTDPEFDVSSDLSGWTQPCDPALTSCGTPATGPTADPIFAADSSTLGQAPEPAAIILTGGGLAAMGMFRRRRKRLA